MPVDPNSNAEQSPANRPEANAQPGQEQKPKRPETGDNSVHAEDIGPGTGLDDAITAEDGASGRPPVIYPSQVKKVHTIPKAELEKIKGVALVKSSAGAYRRIIKYLKPYWFTFVLGMLFGVLFGVANGGMIWVINQVTTTIFPEGGGQAAMLQSASSGEKKAFDMRVLLACMAVPGIMLVRNLFGFLNSYLMLSVGMKVLQDIRSQVFAHIMSMSLDFFDTAKTGMLIQLVYGRTRMIQSAAITLASDVVKQPISIITALVVLFHIDWKFTLGVFLLFPMCLLPVLAMGRMVKKRGVQEEKEAGQLTVLMQEAFTGIRTIKAFNREKYETERVNSANRKTLQNMMHWMRIMEAVGPMVEVVASIGIGAALVYAYFVEHSVGKFIALNMGLVLLYPPFKTLSRIHILMQKVLGATEAIFGILDSIPSVDDAPDAKDVEFKTGQIRFENVTFSFRPGVPAVRGVNLTFESGKYYALVGETGAGKSTLFSLLMRLYDPQEGTVYIDDQDIRTVRQSSLRDQIGLVTQQNFLFNDTIGENIRYGRLDATQEEIEEAAIRAHAHEFILEQSNGYDTEVGDSGRRLSGGQQQRICIARTFLKNAPILLLDEAMSSLDASTEEKIKEALDELAKGRTVISIAHRFSSLQRADEIIVMKNGRVVERGTHQKLYSKGKLYTRLYDLQFKRPDEESAAAPTPEEAAATEEDQARARAAAADEAEARMEAIGFE